MNFDETFGQWLKRYIAWRIKKVVSLAIPMTETASLAKQWAYIGPWQQEAGSFEAEAEYHYRKARWKFREDNVDKIASSVIMEQAKNACSKELWARLDSQNMREDLKDRYFLIREELGKGKQNES